MATWHSSVAVGRPVQIVVYLDPSGAGSPNTAGVTLASTENVTIQVVSATVFNSYTLAAPVTVTSGDAYVGFYDYNNADRVTFTSCAYDTRPPRHAFLVQGQLHGTRGFHALHLERGLHDPDLRDPEPTVRLTWGHPATAGPCRARPTPSTAKPISSLAAEGYNPSPIDCGMPEREIPGSAGGLLLRHRPLERRPGRGPRGRGHGARHRHRPLRDPPPRPELSLARCSSSSASPTEQKPIGTESTQRLHHGGPTEHTEKS